MCVCIYRVIIANINCTCVILYLYIEMQFVRYLCALEVCIKIKDALL